MGDCLQYNSDDNEIFIVDKDVVNEFFKDSNYETAELFFIYLTTQNEKNKAYMLPSLIEDIKTKIKEKTELIDETTKTEVIAYLENWIEPAELLGEDVGEEKHDTKLLYKILSLINPDKRIIILSNSYDDEDSISSLSIDNLWSYLTSKKNFEEYLKKNYGLNDGASY
ncbi:MAG: hypothetical protein KJ566_00645 [Nanoarchaeota archaeon]|nr:hypothetical protein [Nanoarchaeota archaeon]